MKSTKVSYPKMDSNKMKAIVCTKYGDPDVLQFAEVKKPAPKDNEVLIKIHATSATSGDARIRRADPFIIRLIFGFKKPRKSILGVVVAGEIEAIGKEVTNFKVGDQVFGSSGMRFGTYAEYLTMPENGTLALKPKNVNYEEAAAIPFGATAALHFLRKAKIQSGQKILIYGASGAIGTAAIQLAKSFGAKVTAVCSTANIEMVKSLGAEKVFDYTKEDFSKSGEKYDVIFETVGKSLFSGNIKSLNPKGRLLMASAGPSQMIRGLLVSITSPKKVISGVIAERAEDMNYLKELIESGQLKAVIDRSYPLEQAAEAHRYVDTGHKKGNVVITVA
jgi:2-desacetyl-2-hydroxyethyl bacteriochlorophyllide A dehydrogenase